MNQVVPTPKAKSEFLELAHVLLDRLKEPRIQGWWNDLLGLTAQLEDCRRELCLPHWLPEWNADCDAWKNAKHYDAAFDVRPLLDPWWKPGKACHPDCFNIWMQGENGTAESVKFAFCDPYRSMDAWGDSYAGRSDTFAGCIEFCVVTVSLQVAEAELDDGKPVFDYIRRDFICIMKSWIRYVESRPEASHGTSADETDPRNDSPRGGAKTGSDPVEFSSYRQPTVWRNLRKQSGLADSTGTWTALRRYPTLKEHFRGEPGRESKSVAISRWLADQWHLELPEFTQEPAVKA